MADLEYKINVQLPDEPHPGVLIIISGNETVKNLLMAINKKVRKLFKRGYKCQYVTNKEGSVLDPEFTLLSALEREDTVAAHQHKLKTLGEVVGRDCGDLPVPPSAPVAAVQDSSDAAANDSSSDDEDNSSFQDKEAATATKKVAVVTPGPRPAPPRATDLEPPAKKIKKEKKVRDPNMPKRAPNHFMLFMEKNRALIVGEGFRGKHVMSEASRRWNELPPSEKTPYTAEAKQLKDVYDSRMLAYKAATAAESSAGDGAGSGAAVLVAAARAAAAAAAESSAVVAPPPPAEPESESAAATRKAKSAKSKCDYKVLKKVLKQNAGTAVPEFLGAVLAGYNTAKAEAKSSSWLVTKMTNDKMTGFVSSQLSAAHRAAIQK